MDCSASPIFPAKVVAIARDKYLTPRYPFPDPANLSKVPAPLFGQDITFGYGRVPLHRQSVGKTPEELKPKMRKLLTRFASGDRSGMANRLFDAFLSKQSGVTVFDDRDLNAAAANHANIVAFCRAAMSIDARPPVVWGRGGGRSPIPPLPRRRIHQALKEADWDIRKLLAPADLGVPAFNLGTREMSTGDFNNGLGLMINGVQYVYVVATHYRVDPAAGRYCLRVRFILYDVFGLDDEDVEEFGAKDDSPPVIDAKVGITAWWQLQHQHGYAPLVTRMIVERTFEAPTS